MKFVELTGDATAFEILPNTTHFVLHVVNTAAIMGSGIALTIKEKFPKAYYDYINWYKYERGQIVEQPRSFARCLGTENQRWQLGNLQTVKVAHHYNNGGTIWVCNMLCQKDFGSVNMPPGRYEAIEECLRKLRLCIDHVSDKGKSISVESCRFGSCRSGLDWSHIFDKIERIFKDAPGIWNTYNYVGPNQ